MPSLEQRRVVAWVIAGACFSTFVGGLFAIPLTGMSWDEQFHRRYGEMILEFYRSGRVDNDVFSWGDGGGKFRFYGGMFDVMTGLIEKALPGTSYVLIRHWFSFFFGLVGIVYTGRLAQLLGGPTAGIVATVLMATTPRWFGHSLFNPKDVPFASMYVAAMFYLCIVLERLPRPRCTDWLKFAVFVGLSLSIRVAGLLPLCFALGGVGIWAVLQMCRERAVIPTVRYVLRIVPAIALSVTIALFWATAFWPYLQTDPFSRVLEVLRDNTKFPWFGSFLFEGRLVSALEAPANYLPKWFLIVSPPLTLIGLGLVGGGLVRPLDRWCNPGAIAKLGVVAIAFVFPPAYAIYTHAVVYDEMRQFMFVVPVGTALGAIGVAWLYARLKAPPLRWGAVALALLCVLEPVVFMLRAGMLQYTYFNPMVGGLKRGSHYFETDYWGVSLRHAAEWLDAHKSELSKGEILVYMNAPWFLVEPFLAKGSPVRRVDKPEDSTVQIWFYREVTPEAYQQHIVDVLYREEFVDGQIPFFVITRGPKAS